MDSEKSKKILVVDDETAITELIEVILSERGYQVIIANNGKSGIRQFEKFHPDLIITDLVMPDIEGIELLRVLRTRTKSIPIIVMSGNPVGQKFLKASRLLGAIDTLNKPFNPQELIKKIQRALSE